MKERPILMNGPMTRAILEGRKTQERRVVKLPTHTYIDISSIASINPDGKDGWIAWGPKPVTDDFSKKAYPDGGGFLCPYGKPGDRLWVRETWQVVDKKVCYAATPETNYQAWNGWKWRPSIHMPRWASRITLEIIDVKVEQLWQMTVDKMLAEGVPEPPEDDDYDYHPLTPFIKLWDSINAKRGYPWQANPWVWVIEFKRIESEVE